MKEIDLPYILIERVINRGFSGKPAKFDENGKKTRSEFKGEYVEVQRKVLVDSRPPHSPYVWVGPEWIVRQTHPSRGGKIIGYGNFDKFPEDYPKDWKTRLLNIIPIVQPLVNAYEMLKQAQEQIAELKLQQEQANEQSQTNTEIRGPQEGTRRINKASKRALGSSGETAHDATS